MKELMEEGKRILKRKEYRISLLLTAVLGYGYLWMHPSMGVDDTCVARYFADGFAPTQGRWTLFLLNKLFHIAEFSPFIIDVLGVFFLAVSALLFSIVFEHFSNGKLHRLCSVVFSCVFISYPLITEVYVYYLHNGLGLAYMLSAFALVIVGLGDGYQKFLVAGLALTLAFSCYESLAMVYLLGIFLCIFLKGLFREERLCVKEVVTDILTGCIPIIMALVLRSLASGLIMALIKVDKGIEHSILESLRALFADGFTEKLKEMAKIFGRYYIVNAAANFSIFLYWLCVLLFAIISIFYTIKRGNWLLLLAVLGVLASPWLLSLIEMKAEPYRTMQALAVFCGFSLMLLIHFLLSRKRRLWHYCAIIISVAVLYHQVFQLNKWFYVDYLKYQEDVDRASKIAYDIEKYATLDKPVVFVGKIKEYGIVKQYAFLDSDSAAYKFISWVYNKIGMGDPGDYSTEQNLVWYSLFDWGVDAFDEAGTELIHFFQYHGVLLKKPDQGMVDEAINNSGEMGVWPKEGSIVEKEEYVIVKLGEGYGEE